jgi:glucokinase
MFLAGDIGGTSTRLGLYGIKNDFLCVEAQERYPSSQFETLEDALKKFLKDHETHVEAICLGVPGPVRDGKVQLTNLPWEFSEQTIVDALGIQRVRIVNDLFSVAAAVPYLNESELLVLHPGGDKHANDKVTVLAPGTGLGHASAARIRGRWEVFSSEGGHIDFGPRDELSLELLRFLFQKFQRRVSYERVLSGPGLVNVYEFLGTLEQYKNDEELVGEDLPRLISEKGLSGESPRAAHVLDIFARSLGGLAGNCVLYNMCTGGVYLGGGIPPKLIEKLKDGAIIEEYVRQGRMSPIVADAPLYVILNDQAGMIGAAALAQDLYLG